MEWTESGSQFPGLLYLKPRFCEVSYLGFNVLGTGLFWLDPNLHFKALSLPLFPLIPFIPFLIHTNTHTCVYTHTHTNMRAIHTHAGEQAHTYAPMHTDVHMHAHVWTQLHIHTIIQAYHPPFPWGLPCSIFFQPTVWPRSKMLFPSLQFNTIS